MISQDDLARVIDPLLALPERGGCLHRVQDGTFIFRDQVVRTVRAGLHNEYQGEFGPETCDRLMEAASVYLEGRGYLLEDSYPPKYFRKNQ